MIIRNGGGSSTPKLNLNTYSEEDKPMSTAVFCIAPSQTVASTIVSHLKASGFADNDISALFPDKGTTRDFAHEKHTKAPEGAVVGAGTGGALGGTLGLLAGIGMLAIP